MFLEYNVWTGIFGLESVPQWKKPKEYEGRHSTEAEQESFGVIAEKETDLKGKGYLDPDGLL